MISPEMARILCLISLGVLLFLLSVWQAVIARAALADAEYRVPGWPLLLIVWGGFQGTLLTVTFFAGRLL